MTNLQLRSLSSTSTSAQETHRGCVVCVIGTRPEAIKMAPVVRALVRRGIDAPILATAQHRDLLDQMLLGFGLMPRWDLDIMSHDQNLAQLTGRMVPALERIFASIDVDLILAQGDTTTVFCAALAAFYLRIPFGHVEAGLRSGDLWNPYPEEANRRLSGVLTRFHFAPTRTARESLLREGFPDRGIHVIGNTVIDALLDTAARQDLPWPNNLAPLIPGQRLVLMTLHRRESFGEPMARILSSVKRFAQGRPDARVVYPVHPNPKVKQQAKTILGGVANIQLVEPLDYPELVAVMKVAYAVFTDSGGIQEEAPALGKPVLVFREVTERPEAVDAGGVILVGSSSERFQLEANALWDDERHYKAMAKPRFPYGDGHAAERLAGIVSAYIAERAIFTG